MDLTVLLLEKVSKAGALIWRRMRSTYAIRRLTSPAIQHTIRLMASWPTARRDSGSAPNPSSPDASLDSRVDSSARIGTNSLERAFLVMNLVAKKPLGLTNAEISQRLQIATSSCSYILSRLERDEFLTRDQRTGRYKMSLKVLSLANRTLGNLRIARIAEPAMHRLSEATNLSACLTVIEEGRVVIVGKTSTSGCDMLDCNIGAQLPIHASSHGKILSAHLPQDQLNALIERKGLRRLNQRTIVSRSRLIEELDAVRARGFASNNEESQPSVRGIAAPIFAFNGMVTAAVGAMGAAGQPIWNYPQEVVELVKLAARDISRRVRYGL